MVVQRFSYCFPIGFPAVALCFFLMGFLWPPYGFPMAVLYSCPIVVVLLLLHMVGSCRVERWGGVARDGPSATCLPGPAPMYKTSYF
jgi:hypothetical protein